MSPAFFISLVFIGRRFNFFCRQQIYNVDYLIILLTAILMTFILLYLVLISPTFSRAFFACVFHTNVFFLVAFCEKHAQKTLVKATPRRLFALSVENLFSLPILTKCTFLQKIKLNESNLGFT